MKRITLVIALWAVFVATGNAQKNETEQQLIKEANELFDRQEFLKAFPLFSQLVSLYPQDPVYNYKFGTCAIYGQPDKTQAIKHLNFATRKNVDDAMAWYYLGKAYHLNYQFKDALESYKTFNQKVDPKIAAKYNTSREMEMCNYGTGLLANMKDVVVINKVESDRENFFRYFNVEDVGGKILTVPTELRSKLDEKDPEPGIMFYPDNSTTIYFSSYGKDGSTGKDIYKANILPDGNFSAPEKLQGGINTPYDEDFCFMHGNGQTFYFSSKGHNSMGGYDIFKCSYNPSTGTFGEAVNLDFAINTPDDDILFITDKNNERAYFASGRTSDQDHLHVYNVMVQGIPTQVLYLKGDFISEINPEQKNARIVVKDAMTDRPVQEINTDRTSGGYVLYMPKAGDYKFLVSTENSPIVHEGFVNIPQFSQPVAFRQEMRLVKEQGVEKLVINNYFDSPLSDDLASLAAGMLRMKAGLEVNATEELIRETNEEGPSNDVMVEKTMENAPLAAGFAEGISIPEIVTNMNNEASKAEAIANEALVKSDVALAYSFKKQSEAEELLKKAEMIRNQTSTYLAEDDVTRLRESYAMAKKAEKLRMESASAMAAAELSKQKAAGESQKAKDIRTQAIQISGAYTANDFDQALNLLKTEKDRQTGLKGYNESKDLEDLQAKARAKNSEKTAAEDKLASLRQEEKKLTSDLAAAEQKMNAATKKNDKAAAEGAYANTKSALDNKRREILGADIKAQQLNKEATALFEQAEFYHRLDLDKTNMGLASNELRKYSDTEVTSLGFKLNDMDSRLESLEIQDPQMLAILGDINEEPQATASVAEMKSSNETILGRLPKDHQAASEVKWMMYDNTLVRVNSDIDELESMPLASLSASDRTRLDELKTYRTELNTGLQAQPAAQVNTELIMLACNAATPDYESKVLEINNGAGTEVDRAVKTAALKKQTISQLETLKAHNAARCAELTDPDAIVALAEKNRQYSATISTLQNETAGISAIENAYAAGNKSIIESDEDYNVKLNQQILLGESYQTALSGVITETKAELATNPDAARKAELEATLADAQKREQESKTKVSGYRSEMAVAMAAVPQAKSTDAVVANTGIATENRSVSTEVAPADNTAVNTDTRSVDNAVAASTAAVAALTLEDELEKEDKKDENGDHGDEEPAKSKEQQDAETMKEIFTRRIEEESIIAYETGALDEIIAEQECDTMQVNNRDKIALIQDEIFLVEAEMENETSPGKQRSLDRNAEKLYLKRSLLEISNAEAIGKMTNAEFAEHLAIVDQLNKDNKEKIDSRVMIRDEVRTLYNKAKDEIEDAAVLRKKAGPIIDDIEKNDYYRRAFAKEVYAIRLLEQVESIHSNLDMMLTYNDQELTALRYGKPMPKPIEDSVAAAKTEAEKAAGNEVALTTEKSSLTANAVNPGTTGTVGVAMANATGVNAKSATVPTAQMIAAQPMISSSITAEQMAAKILGPNATAAEKEALMESNPFVDYMATMSVASTADASRLALINERNSILSDARVIEAEIVQLEKARDAATTQAEKAKIQGQIDLLIQQRDDKYADIALLDKQIAESTANVQNLNEQSQDLLATLNKSAAASAATANARSANAPSMSASTASGEAMYFNFPTALTGDLFNTMNHSVYSDEHPIPIDAALPAGVYYKIQVGAFRNRIPQDLFDDFAPVSGETVNNGVVRYTAGFFLSYKSADAMKKTIRQMGYSDAFIVAYRDGKRIPLFEAIDKTDGTEFADLIESEYVHGDSAPKKNEEAVNTNLPGGSGEYYKKYPNAVSAVQIETISGLFYTVQVGVYSRAVTAGDLHFVSPLYTELTASKKIRYTSGMFTELSTAVSKRLEARSSGINDAFVTAYYNGKRVSLSEADRLIREIGPSVFAVKR